MQQKAPRHTPRSSPLGVEHLETRWLLSGLAIQLDVSPTPPAGYGFGLLALLQPIDKGQVLRSPVPQAEAHVTALTNAAEASQSDLAPILEPFGISVETSEVSEDFGSLNGYPVRLLTAAVSEDRTIASHTAFPAPGSVMGAVLAEAGPVGLPLVVPSIQGSDTNSPNPRGSAVAASSAKSLSSSLLDIAQRGLLETVRSAALTPPLGVTEPAMVGPKALAWAVINTALREFAVELPVPRGPLPVTASQESLGRELIRELREAHDEQVPSPLAVPARGGDSPNLAAVAFARQHHGLMPIPNAALDADRQGAGSPPLFVVPAVPQHHSLQWDVFAGLDVAGPAGNPVPQHEVAEPLGSPSPSEAEPNAVEAGLPLPQEAGLAAGFFPQNTVVLGQAVRRFLGELDTAGRELTHLLSDNLWMRWVVIISATALTAELGRRRLQRSAHHDAAEEDEIATLSWPADSYPFRSDDAM